MSFAPISFIAPNYRDFKTDWLKAYEPGTTTPKPIAIGPGTPTLVAKLQLNADGFIVSAGGAIVMPYIDGAYDMWLFPTEADADANDTSNAQRVADNLNPSSDETGNQFVSVDETQTLTAGQTTVNLAFVDALTGVFYIAGAGVDRGRLIVDIDYTVASSGLINAIELINSFPNGAVLTASSVALVSSDLVNNLSQAYEFPTVAAYKAYTLDFPVGKVINILDRGASFIVIDGTGTADGYGIIASTTQSQSITIANSRVIEATQFGLSTSATAAFNSGAMAAAITAATSLNKAIHTESGSYSIGTEIIIPSNVEFYGDGKFSTVFLQSALNTPSILISTPQGSEYQNIHDVGVRYNFDSIGATTQVGFKLLGTRRAVLKDCSVDNLGQSISNYSGIGISIDMEATTNAYTHRIENVTVLGSTYGIWSKGPITSSVFTKNHLKTLHGMRFDRLAIQAGSTAIFGNQIYGNLIQAHSSDTFGAGNGIDFGQSDAALAFVYASSNQIGWNYIEQFLNGILFRDGAKNFDVASQSWDNATNQIVDLNPEKDGYSGFDAQNFKLSTKSQTAEFTEQGLKVTDKKTSNDTYWGLSKELNVDADGVTILTNDAYRIRLTGNGAPRTGAVVSRASAVNGQRLVLIGFSWAVSLSTTGLLLNTGTGVNMGNLTTEVARLELEYDLGLDLWVEVSRNTRV